jgi:hypothetical protein
MEGKQASLFVGGGREGGWMLVGDEMQGADLVCSIGRIGVIDLFTAGDKDSPPSPHDPPLYATTHHEHVPLHIWSLDCI